MDKIINPYFIVRKPNYVNEMKFSFKDDVKKKIVFQSLMRDDKDFASINLNTLEEHFNYSYYFSIRENGKWIKKGYSKLVLPEFLDEDIQIEYSFNKYLDSDKLIVVFSSSPTIKNNYNYYRTLKDVHCNKLFLADESFSEDKTQCSYYIGKHKNKSYEKKIIKIITKIAAENNISKENIILTGSSKGGFASLYYLYKYGFGKCIVGSPTIKLGSQHKKSEFGLKIIENLTGGRSLADIEWLDNLIFNELENNFNKPDLYYHAGNKESRYLYQGSQFLKKLVEINKSSVDINLGDYQNHRDVVSYFPQYLLNTVNRIIQ